MTEQPNPTHPRFRPVPAMPIVVESHRGEWRMRMDGGVFSGPTLRAAIDAARALTTKETPNA